MGVLDDLLVKTTKRFIIKRKDADIAEQGENFSSSYDQVSILLLFSVSFLSLVSIISYHFMNLMGICYFLLLILALQWKYAGVFYSHGIHVQSVYL